jgi:DNA-binding MarR family transcriptional regulator
MRLEEQQLRAWRLFITANARLVEKIDKKMQKSDNLPLHWYDVLVELVEAPEQRLRFNELAARVVLSKSGLTRLVDRLEQEGLLKRESVSGDRRGAYAVLTDLGREKLRQSWKVYAPAIVEHFALHISDDELNIITNVFERILEALNSANPDAAP